MCKEKKKALFNKVDARVLKQQMEQSSEERTTISFYRYFKEENPQELRDQLFLDFTEHGVCGRVYVANEGINAQFSLPTANLEGFRTYLDGTKHLKNLRLNIAVEDDGKSFYKLIIKVRTKIVADGLDDSTFDPSDMGKHLSVSEFNNLTDKKETILVDMRNHYESEVGHFKGAILPDCDTFRDELPMVVDMFKDQKD